MTTVTNPFDDTFEEARVSTNPFANDDGVSSNPFQASVPHQTSQDSDLPSMSANAPAEASWQYLGDLPYRRVPVYSNVVWDRQHGGTQDATTGAADDIWNHGLAKFPPSALKHHPDMLDHREVRALLNNTTVTKVAGCPHGGPIAAITLPVVSESSDFKKTELRIMTNAGKPLVNLEFPPRGLEHRYSPADVLTIGFTARTVLIVVLRDSLCLTFDLQGDAILHPFHILPRENGNGTTLRQASVYEGGVAVLAENKNAALVELLDDHDDPAYVQGAHIASRRIAPVSNELGGQEYLPPHYALVTPLPTAAHASSNFLSYLAIAVLSRARTTSRHPEVFISTSDNSVIVVNSATTEITDVDCRARISSPIVDMCFAPNGRFLACFTEQSMLTVISASFETKVLDFDTSEGSSSPPLEMKWCGEDSVVLHWKNLGVLMVGPYGDWLRFPYEGTENVYLIPEVDCCRVITDTSVEILQRVPPATALLLRIGSIETSAMLLDAADAFESGSPASDEAARAIVKTGSLAEAIETCTDAATKEFDIVTQKRLLRAASYGMHFAYKNAEDEEGIAMGGPVSGSEKDTTLPSATTVAFVDGARKLRILNALRNPNVGFVLTAAQCDAITWTGVIARLIAMKRPALATSISKYLCLSKAVQLYSRASKAAALVAAGSGRSDSETAEAAMRIINEGVPADVAKNNASSINRGAYATVAMAAAKAGRPGVAKLLLMLETSVADKVPALISSGSYADAIAVATTARDAEFIFSTLMEYERFCVSTAPNNDVSKAQSTFLGTVVQKFTPEAFHTLRRYLATTMDVKSVTNLLLRAQRFADAGSAMASRAIQESDTREKQGMLSVSMCVRLMPTTLPRCLKLTNISILQEASRLFGLGKETAFHKACTDEYLELLKDQEVLRTKYGAYEVAPETSSVTTTISSVIIFAAVNVREQHRLLSDADKIGKKFRIPEKRLWYIKVKAFAESEQWSNLRILADSKTKPPIGFKPFARAAIRGKQSVAEVMKFIEKIPVLEERYDLFCEAGLWKNALEEASRLKDGRRIMNVKTLCNSQEIQLLADQTLARIA